MPAAHNSATVLPDRASTRSAAPYCAGISVRNASTDQRAGSAPLAVYAARVASRLRAPDWCTIVNPDTVSSNSATIFGIVSLKTSAPLLPAVTSNLGGTPTGLGGSAKISARTGTPVASALRKYFSVCSKFTAAALTHRPSQRFVIPGTAFGSYATVGTRFKTAASIPGPLAYPPTPTTTCGLNCRSSRTHSTTPNGTSTAVRRRVARLTFFSCPDRTSSSLKPASGTSRVSSPRAVPTNRTSAPCASRNSRAIASAGITCPPVPPPAINTRSALMTLEP